jgi:SAM-dependent methyltransferase
MTNPYDELPYRATPIEWTAPERLALASLLHGGPRVDIHAAHRVLELGCADGANLLPMAYYRRHASFVGVDGARTQTDLATARAAELGLSNVAFVHADFTTADACLAGQFDFIVVHGVFSWIPPAGRDALLQLCARRLRPGGLLYLNYNAKPGWNVRGMVREFLLAQTADLPGLRARAEAARSVCHRLIEAMGGEEHAYRRLMLNELRLVRDGDPSYVAHEYLAPDNHAYWHSELLALVGAHGLAYVADADFDQPWARLDDDFTAWLHREQVRGQGLEDTVDLLLYRQLRSPILTQAPLVHREAQAHELAALHIASQLAPLHDPAGPLPMMFGHPSGYEVEVSEAQVRDALVRLAPCWPRGLRVDEAFTSVPAVTDDLRLLQRNGLVTLRYDEPADCSVSGTALNRLEAAWSGYQTAPDHGRVPVAAPQVEA